MYIHSFSLRKALAIASGALMLATSITVHAEVGEVRIAQQFGFASVPLMVMQRHHLLQKHLEIAGLSDTKINWLTFSGGSTMNDALLSGSLDFAAGGVTPLLTIWDKSKGRIKGAISLGSIPLVLVSVNPSVKSLQDFTENDKIAVPAIKVSIQAVFLQMAAANQFGGEHHNKMDKLTVGMKHPDAVAAMLSKTEVTAHISSSPFVEQELQLPNAHKVLSSYDVLGSTTNVALYARSKFHEANPKTYAAVIGAVKEAIGMINKDKEVAVDSFIAIEKTKLSRQLIAKAFNDPQNVYTPVPEGFMKYADFMYQIGSLGKKPSDWKEIFFPEIHDMAGS